MYSAFDGIGNDYGHCVGAAGVAGGGIEVVLFRRARHRNRLSNTKSK